MMIPPLLMKVCKVCKEEKAVTLHFGSKKDSCKECLNKKRVKAFHKTHGKPGRKWVALPKLWRHQRDVRDKILDVG